MPVLRTLARAVLAVLLGTGCAVAISVDPAGAQPGPVTTSRKGAGFSVSPAVLSSVTATYTMPSITCANPNDIESLLPGLWLFTAGGDFSGEVNARFECIAGSQSRNGYVCLTGAACDVEIDVAPGDKIVASLEFTATATIGTLRDLTARTSAQKTAPASPAGQTVFIGDIGPSLFGGHIVPAFSSILFSRVQVNGADLVNEPSAMRYNLKTRKVLQIITTGIHANGSAFRTTFRHAWAPARPASSTSSS